MIRFGLSLPDGGECGDARFALELGRRAEDAGWDGVFYEDYISYQGDPRAPTCDAWSVLAALAGGTKRVTLGTSVTPLPRRRPWVVARQAVAIDELSEGRFVLGAGIGDSGESVLADASLTRFGDAPAARERGQMLDEQLTIIAGLWSGEPFRFTGRHYAIDEVTFVPRPLQQPRIPIWIGGGYPIPGPTQRALRWDGSILYKAPHLDPRGAGMTPDDVGALRAIAGDRPFTIAVGGAARSGDSDADRARVAETAEAGADWWFEWVPPRDRHEMRAAVDRGPLR